MTEHLGERLSALVDGEVSGEALAAAESHLAACAACRGAYDDLLRIRRLAAGLDDRPPERDLWPGIAAEITGEHEVHVVPMPAWRRRVAVSIPQLAAAAIALVALSAGAAIVATHARGGAGLPGIADAVQMPPAMAGLASAKGVESYEAAIRDLELTLAVRRSKLDTATVRAVEQSLAVIDRAIRQAEAALEQDPNSMYLNSHLQNALDRKLEVLRRVTTLAAAS
jgi:negative regulator of sigma E activity